METLTDLVEKKRLYHQFQNAYTIHVFLDLSHDGEQQPRVQRWRRKHVIGSGGFGKVWLEILEDKETPEARQPANLKFRAVKEISKSGVADQAYKRELEAIVNFSQEKYSHLFVQSYGWFHTDDTVFIAMEYLKNGNLGQHLGKPLPVLEAQQIAVQILEGLEYMHSEGFTHRDLKPANLLVESFRPWKIKIGDFGLSKQVLGDLTYLRTEAGTPLWAPPEYFDSDERSGHYTSAVDIWSFGVIVFYMLTGKRPFTGTAHVIDYGRGQAEFPESALDTDKNGPDCVDFLKNTIAPKPEGRLDAYCSLEHSWLKAHRESRSSLHPIGEVDPTSTSPLPANGLGGEKMASSNPDTVSSSASGTWGFLDETVMPIRNAINSAPDPPELATSHPELGRTKTSNVDSDKRSTWISRSVKRLWSLKGAPPRGDVTNKASHSAGKPLTDNDYIDSNFSDTGAKQKADPQMGGSAFGLPNFATSRSKFDRETSNVGSDRKLTSVSQSAERPRSFERAQSRGEVTSKPSFPAGNPTTDDDYLYNNLNDTGAAVVASGERENPIIFEVKISDIHVGSNEERASPIFSPLDLHGDLCMRGELNHTERLKMQKLQSYAARGRWTTLLLHVRQTLRQITPSNPNYGNFQYLQGLALLFSKQLEEAEHVFHAAKKSQRSIGDFTIYVILAETMFRQGRQDECISFVRLALETPAKNRWSNNKVIYSTEYVLGDLLGRDLKTQPEAVRILMRVLSQRQSRYGPDNQPVAFALASLADCYCLSQNWMRAADFLRKALATNVPRKANWKYHLQGCYFRAGKDEEAVAYFQNDVKDVSKKYGTHNIHFLESQFLLWKSLLCWDWIRARSMTEELTRLSREFEPEDEVGRVWFDDLKEGLDHFSNDKNWPFRKGEGDGKKARTAFPNNPFRILWQINGTPKAKRR
ncbi:unnamed protein product [Penicillium glandicola]